MTENVRHVILAVAHYMFLKRHLTPPYTQSLSAEGVAHKLCEAAKASGFKKEIAAVVIPFQQ